MEYRIMQEGDISAIVDLISESFFTDEPLNASLAFQSPRETQFHIDFLVKTCVKDGISIVVVDTESGQLAGCRLSTIGTRGISFSPDSSPDNPDHHKMIVLGQFLETVEKGVNVFDKYHVNECVQFAMLNVRKDFRNKGLAKRLVEESMKVARRRGIKVAKTVATNKYSKKLYERLEYDKLNEVRYEDYRDESGKVVFTNMGDHYSAVAFAKFIE